MRYTLSLPKDFPRSAFLLIFQFFKNILILFLVNIDLPIVKVRLKTPVALWVVPNHFFCPGILSLFTISGVGTIHLRIAIEHIIHIL